jgi:hypothetical protein
MGAQWAGGKEKFGWKTGAKAWAVGRRSRTTAVAQLSIPSIALENLNAWLNRAFLTSSRSCSRTFSGQHLVAHFRVTGAAEAGEGVDDMDTGFECGSTIVIGPAQGLPGRSTPEVISSVRSIAEPGGRLGFRRSSESPHRPWLWNPAAYRGLVAWTHELVHRHRPDASPESSGRTSLTGLIRRHGWAGTTSR